MYVRMDAGLLVHRRERGGGTPKKGFKINLVPSTWYLPISLSSPSIILL